MTKEESTTGPIPPELLPELSIVVPVWNEEGMVGYFYQKLIQSIENKKIAFELVFVDDGSSDQTFSCIQALHQQDPRVKGVRFSRNFGKELALTAGLRLAKGAAVIPMDVDLQDPPALIPEMVALWQAGHPVVLAKRIRRDDPIWKKWSAACFYRLFNWFSACSIPPEVGDFRLLDRRVVDEINRLGEQHRLMKGLFAWVGFPAVTIEFHRPAEHRSDRKMGVRKLWALAQNGIISFSHVPLRLLFAVGWLLSALGLGTSVFAIIQVSGMATLVGLLLMLSGLQFFGLGVMGQYMARMYDEVKGRPLYVIDQKLGV